LAFLKPSKTKYMKTKTNGGHQAVLKLNLNKRTVSNLNTREMNEKNGGWWSQGCHGPSFHCTNGCTRKHTCVYTCI